MAYLLLKHQKLTTVKAAMLKVATQVVAKQLAHGCHANCQMPELTLATTASEMV